MRISSVLCFLLLTSNSHAAFWKKGEKSKRRRLTENTIPDNVEMDAATGTVTNPAAETKASQTCDGQMAQSLVKANEEMMKAQAELLDMKQEKAQDLKNILELTEVVEIATRDIQDMKAAQAFKIQDLETAYDDLKKKMTDELQEAIALKDQRIESLSESLEMSREELVSEYEDQLKAVEARRMEDETKLTASLSEALDNSHMALEKAAENLKETKSKHEEEIEGWKSALESANKEASETREDSLEKLKETHGQEIAKLRSELEDQKKAAGLTLEQYKDETKVLLLAQTEEKDKQIDAAMVQAKQAKESMKDQIMELEAWRSNFANRSYCNLTHIGEDISWVGALALDKATNLTLLAYESSLEYAKNAGLNIQEYAMIAWEETIKYTKQAQVEATKLYQEQVQPQYKQHILPVFDKHVTPLIAKATMFIGDKVQPKFSLVEKELTPRYNQVKEQYNAKLDSLSVQYASVCKKSFNVFQNVAQQHSVDSFDEKIAPHFKYSCSNPKESLQAAQYGMLVLLMLPFRERILGLAWGIVRLAFWMIVALTPLRLFIKTQPTTSSGNKGEVRVKKKSKVSFESQ